jgi:hypothetical protein
LTRPISARADLSSPPRGAFLNTVGGGLTIWLTSDYAYDYLDGDSIYYLNEAISHISATGYFFANLADICLFITFIELASGFMLCLKGDGKPAPSRRISRFAILAWGFVLFAVSISYFGLAHAAASRYRRAYTDPLGRADRARELAEYNRDALTLSRLAASFEILKWLTSIPMLGAGSYVVHKTRNHEILRSVRPPSRPLRPPPPTHQANADFLTTHSPPSSSWSPPS